MAETYRPALDDPDAFVFYRYHPSLAAAVIFVLAFAIATLYHLWIVIRRKTWYFIPFVIGGLCSVIAYAGRAASAKDQWVLMPYIIQSIFLLATPPLFAASIYMILGRLITALNADDIPILRPTLITKVFVVGDVISLFAQCGGGGIMAVNQEMMKIGEKIIIAGLFVQLAFFGFFVYISAHFHIRYARIARTRGPLKPSSSSTPAFSWLKHMANLYAASALILIRSVFRVIEYIEGNNGPLMRSEVYLYVFDSTLMLLVMVLFAVVHPEAITRFSMDKEQREESMVALSWSQGQQQHRTGGEGGHVRMESGDDFLEVPMGGRRYRGR